MTIRQDVAFIAGFLLVAAAFLVFWSWKDAHDSLLKAQGATEQRIETDKSLAQVRQDTERQLQAMTATVDMLRAQLARTPTVTAPQIIREQVPSLANTQPTIITVPAQPATSTTPAVPTQQFAQLPLPAFQSAERDIAARLLDCSTHEAQLQACQADKKVDVEQMQALEAERNAWRKAAGQGGGFFTRAWHKAEPYVFGGLGIAGGVLIERATR